MAARDRLRDFNPSEKLSNQVRVGGNPGAAGKAKVGTVGARRSGGAGGAAGGAAGQQQVQVEHVTVQATAGQTIADGGGPPGWGLEAGAPRQRRGFDALALPVTEIPISATGVMNWRMAGRWADFTGCDQVTVTLLRNGNAVGNPVVFDLGPVQSRAFDGADDGWEVRAGDTLRIVLANDSGEGQTLTSLTFVGKIIAVGPVGTTASTVTPAGEAELIASETATDGDGDVTIPVPGGAQVGDLLVVVAGTQFGSGGTISWTGPGSWTEEAEVLSQVGGAGVSLGLFSRVVDGTEAGSYEFGLDLSAIGVAGVMLLIRGGTTVTFDTAIGVSVSSLPVGPAGGSFWLVATSAEGGGIIELEGGAGLFGSANFVAWTVTSDGEYTITGLSGNPDRDSVALMLGVS